MTNEPGPANEEAKMSREHKTRSVVLSFTRGQFEARCSCGWKSGPVSLTTAEEAMCAHPYEAAQEITALYVCGPESMPHFCDGAHENCGRGQVRS